MADSAEAHTSATTETYLSGTTPSDAHASKTMADSAEAATATIDTNGS